MGIFDWFLSNEEKKEEKENKEMEGFKDIVQVKKFENYSDFVTQCGEEVTNYESFSEALEHGLDEEIPRRLWRILNEVKDRSDWYLIRFKNVKGMSFRVIKKSKFWISEGEPRLGISEIDYPFDPSTELIRKVSDKSPKLMDYGFSPMFEKMSTPKMLNPNEIMVYMRGKKAD